MSELKAAAVRYNNWLMGCLTKKPVQVDWLVIKHIQDGNMQAPPYDNSPVYAPILLNEDILLKAGFKMGVSKGISRITDDLEYDSEAAGDTYYWDLRVPKNDHVEDLSTFNLVQFGEGNPILWAHQWLRVKVKYLHELQNLYHSLTGRELNCEL